MRLACAFAENLRRARNARGLSQVNASEKAGVAQSTWSALENGKQEPSWDQLERLCSALGCTINDLVDQSPLSLPLLHDGAPKYTTRPDNAAELREALTAAMDSLDETRKQLARVLALL